MKKFIDIVDHENDDVIVCFKFMRRATNDEFEQMMNARESYECDAFDDDHDTMFDIVQCASTNVNDLMNDFNAITRIKIVHYVFKSRD